MGIVPPTRWARYRGAWPNGQPEIESIPVLRWFLLIPTAIALVALGLAVWGTAMQMSAGEGISPGRRTLAVWARESIGRLVILALSPAGWTDDPAPRPTGPASGHTPLLLIPGYGTNRSAFLFLRTYLSHRGWTWVWPVNHAGRELTLEHHVRRLARQIEQLKRASGADKVDVVGFSMGGVIAASYVTEHGGSAHVRRLVTLGSPWAGSRMAQMASTPLAKELGPDSAIFERLDPAAVDTVAIWSPDDPVIVPASSAAPDGAQLVQVDGAGHLDLVMSARVFRAVRQALEAA